MRIGRSLAYTLALPLLAGMAAFSNKDRFPDVELTYLFSWLLLFALGVIFVGSFKYRGPAIAVFIAVVLVRALLAIAPEIGGLSLVSIALYALITIVAGAALVLKEPILLLRQMYWLSAISIAISLLQIQGVVWAQEFGSAVDWKVRGDFDVLFVPYSDDFKFAMTQSRPDGFTHANNLTSQLLMFFYGYALFLYSFRTGLPRPPLLWLFVIAFACALTAGKVIVLGILMTHAIAWLVPRKRDWKALLRTLAVTLAAFALYFVLFPGLFIINFNLDWFIFNAMGRIMNLQSFAGITTFQPLVDLLSGWYSNKYLDIENPERWLFEEGTVTAEAFSGISFMLDYFWIIVPGTIVGVILLAMSLRRLEGLPVRNLRYLVMIMFCTSVSSVFGGPFVTTVWFLFFLSFSLIPVTLPYLSTRFKRSIAANR